MENLYNHNSSSKNQFAKFFSNKIVIAVLVLALLVGGFFVFTRIRADKKPATSTAATDGSKIVYPDAWKEQKLSETDIKKGISLALERRDPDADILVIIGKVTPNFNGEAELKKAISKEKKEKGTVILNEGVTNIAGRDVVQLRYTRPAANSNDIYETIHFIIPTDKQTVQLTGRTHKGDFGKVEGEISSIAESFVKYVNAHQGQN